MKGNGKTVLRSTDGGMTWQSHPLGVERPAGRSYALSIVKDEFWVTGKNSKASGATGWVHRQTCDEGMTE